jgi:hypothetical protein
MGPVPWRVGIIIPLCILLAGCATVRQKTESCILAQSPRISLPVNACLANIDIVSDNLPLTEDYGLITDSLVAIAARHGIRLSPARGDQPYAMELSLHEHSSADDLNTRYSVMAVLDIGTSADASRPLVRIVHSAVMRESAVSLYRVAEISEQLFAAMEKALADASRAAPATEGGS